MCPRVASVYHAYESPGPAAWRDRIRAAFLAKPIQSRDVLDALLDYVGDFIGRAMKSLLVIEPDGDCRNTSSLQRTADDVQVTAVPDAAAGSPDAPRAAGRLCNRRGRRCRTWRARCWPLAKRGAGAWAGCRHLFGEGRAHPDGTGEWKRLADTCTATACISTERLLDLTSFFYPAGRQSAGSQRQLLLELHQSDKLWSEEGADLRRRHAEHLRALPLLEEHEMVISSADNGRDASASCGRSGNDIVLMDIMMPEMDGWRRCRKSARTRR